MDGGKPIFATGTSAFVMISQRMHDSGCVGSSGRGKAHTETYLVGVRATETFFFFNTVFWGQGFQHLEYGSPFVHVTRPHPNHKRTFKSKVKYVMELVHLI